MNTRRVSVSLSLHPANYCPSLLAVRRGAEAVFVQNSVRVCLCPPRHEPLQVSDRVQIKGNARDLDDSTRNPFTTSRDHMPFETGTPAEARGHDERRHPQQSVRAFAFLTRDQDDFGITTRLPEKEINILCGDQWQVGEEHKQSSCPLADAEFCSHLHCAVNPAGIVLVNRTGPELAGKC